MIVPGRDDEMCLAAGLFKLAEIAGAAFMPKVWMIDDAQVHIRSVSSRLTTVVLLLFLIRAVVCIRHFFCADSLN